MRRAAERREISPDADVEILAHTVPALATYQMMFMKQPPDRAFFESIIDHVLLPAVGLTGSAVRLG